VRTFYSGLIAAEAWVVEHPIRIPITQMQGDPVLRSTLSFRYGLTGCPDTMQFQTRRAERNQLTGLCVSAYARSRQVDFTDVDRP
jgi:hypothetical protein